MKIKDLFFFSSNQKKREKNYNNLSVIRYLFIQCDRETVLIQFNYEKMEDFLFFFFIRRILFD